MTKPIRRTSSENRSGGKNIIPVIAGILLALAVALFIVAFTNSSGSSKKDDGKGKQTEQIKGDSDIKTPEKLEEDIQNTEPEKEPEPEPEPKKVKKDISFLDDAVFIGDSVTEGIEIHGISNATIFAYKGLSTYGVLEKPIQKYDNKTMMQLVDSKNPAKIYVMFGSNEVGTEDITGYIKRYGKLIDALKEHHPKAVIYVQSIMPVTKKYDEAKLALNNERISNANAALKILAEEKGVEFLDTNSALADSEGCLPDDYSPDGIHFGKLGFDDWREYILENS